MTSERQPQVRFHIATRSFNLPEMVGKLGNTILPRAFSVPQLATAAAVVAVGMFTRFLWGGLLPDPFDLIFIGIAAVAAGFGAHYGRVDGRTPGQSAVGIGTFLSRPRRGRVAGSAVRLSRRRYSVGAWTED